MRDYVKYAGVLFAITFVTALLLGIVNSFSAPVIENNNREKIILAVETVVDGKIDTATATEHTVTGDSTVQQITSYINDSGKTVYAVKAVPSGYGGDIEMMIGIDDSGLVTGVEIINMSETPGLGAVAKGNTQWLSQFMGEGNSELDAITGATITSRAIEQGVEDAKNQVMNISITGGAGLE